ncbi:MAG: hypothetical protein M1834_005473 [Cirrosporium novae-zelandiae]|nr:MAG: hypothetical protein M1834_005473 [Cirrosporium novae-zelandiae]
MARSVDALIKFLLDEIAWCGEQEDLCSLLGTGASLDDFSTFVETFYKNGSQDGTSTQATFKPPTVDRVLKEKVWSWLVKCKDVSVGKDRTGNGLSLSGIEAWNANLESETNCQREQAATSGATDNAMQVDTPSLAQLEAPENSEKASKTEERKVESRALRIYVSQERMWHALAGHSPDFKRIPGMEFALLQIVASARENGILQTDVTRISGQDKRSTPRRLDTLQEKGYIEKRKVQARKMQTSLCIHYKFLNQHRNRDATVSASGNGEAPKEETGVIDFKIWIQQIFNMLRGKELISVIDLKKNMDVVDSKWRSRVLSRLVRRLEGAGFLKRVRARSTCTQERVKDMLYKCIQLVREPQEKEIDSLLKISENSLADPPKDDAEDAGSGSDDEAIEPNDIPENALKVATGVQEKSNQIQVQEVGRKLPEWTSDRHIANLLFSEVQKAGINGISTMDLRLSTCGPFYYRPFEHYLSRVVDIWELSQPPHLRHLAIIRDTAMGHKTAHYIHYTYDKFEERVKMGRSVWEAVRIDRKELAKKAKGKKGLAIEEPKLDDYGFPIEQKPYQMGDGSYTIAECLKASRSKLQPFHLGRKDPVQKKLPDGSIILSYEKPKTTRTYSKRNPPNNRKRTASAAGLTQSVEDVEDVSEPAGVKDSIESPQLMLPPPKPAVRKLPNAAYSNKKKGQVDTKWLEEETAFLNRSSPGIYIPPKGWRDPDRTTKGRPRRTKTVVFRSPRIKDLEWFKPNTPPPPPPPRNVEAPEEWTANWLASRVATETSGMRSKSHSSFGSGSPMIGVEPSNSILNSNSPHDLVESTLSEPSRATKKRKRQLSSPSTPLIEHPEAKKINQSSISSRRSSNSPIQNTEAESQPGNASFTSFVPINQTDTAPLEDAQESVVQTVEDTLIRNRDHSVESNDVNAKADRLFQLMSEHMEDDDTDESHKEVDKDQENKADHLSKSNSHINETETNENNSRGNQSPALTPAIQEWDNQDPSEQPSRNAEETQPQDRSQCELPTLCEKPFDDNQPPSKAGSGNRARYRTLTRAGPWGGSIGVERRKIIMKILQSCNGIFPGDKELWYPFVTLWMKAGHTGKPDGRTIKTALKGLVDSRKLKQLVFCFKDKSGVMITKNMFTFYDMSPNDIRVQALQKKMIAMSPSIYIPPEAEVNPDLRKNWNDNDRKAFTITDMKVKIENPPAYLKHAEQNPEEIEEKRKAREEATKAREARLEEKRVRTNKKRNKQGRPSLPPTTHPVPASSRKIARLQPIHQSLPFQQHVPALLPEPPQGLNLPFDPDLPASDSEDFMDLDADLEELASAYPHIQKKNKDEERRNQMHGYKRTVILSAQSHPNHFENSFDRICVTSLTQPLQQFYPSSGVFSTEFGITKIVPKPVSTKKSLPMLLPKDLMPGDYVRERRLQKSARPSSPADSEDGVWDDSPIPSERLGALTPCVPKNLQDILTYSRNATKSFEQCQNPDRSKFMWEVDRVSDFERTVPISQISPSWNFIDHTFPGLHQTPDDALSKAIFNSAKCSVPVLSGASLEDSEVRMVTLEQLESGKLFEDGKKHQRKVPGYSKIDDVEPLKRPKGPRNIAGSSFAPTSRFHKKRQGRQTGHRVSTLANEFSTKQVKGPQPLVVRRTRNNYRDIPQALKQRVMTAVVVIRSVIGGLERTVDWPLVASLFDKYDVDFIHDIWRRVSQSSRTLVDKMQRTFEELFIQAYENGDVPPINFNKLTEYDWNGLVDWAYTRLPNPRPDKVLALPATKKEFKRQYEIKEIEEVKQVNMDIFHEDNANESVTDRRARLSAISFVIPIRPAKGFVKEKELYDLAKNWVRANVITPESTFDQNAAAEKLKIIGNKGVDDAVNNLIQNRVLTRANKGRYLPGRGYDVTEYFLHQMRKSIQEHDLRRAATYKNTLDEQFKEDGVAMFSFHAEDGDVLAVHNLVANHLVKIGARNVPMNKKGLTDGGYKTRMMDKKRLLFDMELRPSESYIYGNPLSPLPSIPDDHLRSPMSKIPVWFDINDNFVSVMWSMALAAVLSSVALRPGLTATEMARMARPSMERWEIEIVLEWAIKAGGIEKIEKESYVTKTWWWMLLG